MNKNDQYKFNRKCPISNNNTEKTEETSAIANNDNPTSSASTNAASVEAIGDQNTKLNSKYTVSIQSNEEKAKENVLGKFKKQNHILDF